ncbi:unnamed protein product [Clonostachys byssicola]|uniref:Nephrocystin 3-like N-terminal domain-containing protein n=1 Tax=Clonostachys byssicola TaxID=160290 RepID=A0A9N9UNQ9_9HYPO|nr:unnamed protein product [Clonostachys byssicola]
MSADYCRSFRLRGIPCGYQSRIDVRELVKKVLCIEPDASVVVHSLAINPVHENSQVATLSFHTTPNSLSDCSRNEWDFELLASDTSGDDALDVISLVFDTHFWGFTPLHRTKDSDCHIDIIAISGLNGHAFGSFKRKQGSFMWLRDALPLDVRNARILIYGYDTQLIQSHSFQNLTDLGRTLQGYLKTIRKSNDFRPIIFIGHSLGGLVVKEVGITFGLSLDICVFNHTNIPLQAVVQLKKEQNEEDGSILKSIAAFLFFGVPHQGMAIESLVPLVHNSPNMGLLQSLDRNSPLLPRLTTDFSKSFVGKTPRTISFYETEKSRTAVEITRRVGVVKCHLQHLQGTSGKWELSGPFEVLVDISSATYGSDSQHPVNRNHSELVKYNSQYDGIYERVRNVLQSLNNILPREPVYTSMEVESHSSSNLSNETFECLKSLSFREQEHRYNDILSAENTCGWLLEDSQYQAWMNQPGSLFWIKGNPGAGKSVLMKFAVTMMKQREPNERVLSFFVHGRGAELQKTPLGMFRALLHSMLELFPDYLSSLTSQFNDQEKRRGSYQENRWQWQESELKKIMSEILTKGTKKQPIVLFVDALDECGKHHAKSLLSYFRDLMEDVKREGAQVKICFSSRHYPILGLDKIPSISVEERNDKDIRSFVRSRLSDIQPAVKRQKLETEILQKAHGGFQWTVLIVDKVMEGYINGVNAHDLYHQLETTPEALGEFYGKTLSSVAGVERKQMVKLFSWILFAKQPLSLQELREALTTDKDMAHTSISELRHYASTTLDEFERHVRYISRGLVEFQTREIWEQYEVGGEESDKEAQFIHQSVADYVLEEFLSHTGSGSSVESTVGAGHFQISRSCLRYMTLREILEGTQLTRGSLSVKFPLLPYVVRNLFYHIQKVEQEGILQLDLLPIIHNDWQPNTLRRIASVWRIMDPYRAYTPMGWPFVEGRPLHSLVTFGSKSAFDAFLEMGDVQVDDRDSHGNTSLLLAIRERHQEIALALLERSTKWQNRHEVAVQIPGGPEETMSRSNYVVDVDAENNDGETSLDVAFQERLDEVIIKLIEAGADLGSSEQETGLLFHAIDRRHELLFAKLLRENVKLDGAVYFTVENLIYTGGDKLLEDFIVRLLDAGANTSKNVEAYDESDEDDEEIKENYEAILLASRTGQTSLVSLLLSHGVSTTVIDGTFFLAVKNGHEEIAKMLIDNEADINTRIHGLTPLSYAIRNGHEVIVKMLIDNEADINIRIDGLTPLSYAIRNGHEAIVKMLIDNEADINTRIDGLTPLSYAILNGHEAIVKMLIDNEADINIRIDGLTPLLYAIQNSHEAIVKMLIDYKADVNIRHYQTGSTPLLSALQGGHKTIADMLLHNGADVNSSNIQGLTPLLYAIQSGQVAMVNALIERGADLNAYNNKRPTPLFCATQNSEEALAKILIESGADPNACDNQGLTPLLWASQNGKWEIANALVEMGAFV